MVTTPFSIGALAVLMPFPSAGAAPRAGRVTYRFRMSFMLVPAGSSSMGSGNDNREAGPAEKPRHGVTLTRPFYLARHGVMQAKWEPVMGRSPYDDKRSNPYYGFPGMAVRLCKPDHPSTMSWNDAPPFIRRLGQLEGRGRCRLPSETEWESAARLGTTTAYSFGGDVGQLARQAWYGADFATSSTHPVGQKLPNAWGLYEMHGKVWECVQHGFCAAYDARSPAVDPIGPETGTNNKVHGGSWHVTSDGWRSAFCKPFDADYRAIRIAMRLVMDIAR